MPLLFDAHLDLAWNALSFDRDLTESIEQINLREIGISDSNARGNATVNLPEMRRGRVAACLGTLLVHDRPDICPMEGHQRISLDYRSRTAASAIAFGQLAYYQLLDQQGQLTIIRTVQELNHSWQQWESIRDEHDASEVPIGVILAMEGADAIITPTQVAVWAARGVRVIGLVHYGHNQYAHGTGEAGPLTAAGRQLLQEMESANIILDVTHLSDEGVFEAIDTFSGPIMASHQNCREVVPGERQFSDEQLRRLLTRDAVIGVALDNWMLVSHWVTGKSSRQEATLNQVVDHIDRICQIAGDDLHVAIGSDLDGGYGTEQSPIEITTIADMQKLTLALENRGYAAESIQFICHGNWLRFFRKNLPSTEASQPALTCA